MGTAKRARVEDEGEAEEEDNLDDDVDLGKLNTFSILIFNAKGVEFGLFSPVSETFKC